MSFIIPSGASAGSPATNNEMEWLKVAIGENAEHLLPLYRVTNGMESVIRNGELHLHLWPIGISNSSRTTSFALELTPKALTSSSKLLWIPAWYRAAVPMEEYKESTCVACPGFSNGSRKNHKRASSHIETSRSAPCAKVKQRAASPANSTPRNFSAVAGSLSMTAPEARRGPAMRTGCCARR